ncbi:TonB-dependent receptor [Erythrobacter donghaensis]|uniref:TonB-dependent receptor n=1 Tax=Erythrobacter donghaensis TaxID=267135 RepID=UPI001302A329|nr:TonB-dependent receptor [Erythrobacter donghaensis]
MHIKNQSARLLFAGASALTLAASPALAKAQEQAGPEDAEEADGQLPTIIVSATRRANNVQDVPIAVTAISAQVLDRAGVADITTLDAVVPSFNLNASGTTTGGITLRIRGIGTTGNNAGLESAVGVYLDGVYLSRPGVALGDLLDIERVEVLRGPQGTLFGRNTSAGALDIRTRKPELDRVDGFANATYGNFDLVNLQAGINLPLVTDKIGLRLAGAVRDRDGYITGPTGVQSNSIERLVLRGQVLFDFGSAGDLRIIGDYTEGDDSCCHAIWVRDGTSVNFPAFGLPADGGAPNVGDTALDGRRSNDGQFDTPFETWGISAEYNVDTPLGALTYVGSYRDFEFRTSLETDYTQLRLFTAGASDQARALGGQNFEPRNNPTRIKTTTHELRLQGDAFEGRLDWLIGGYYSWERISQQLSLTLLDQFQAGVSGGLLGAVPLQPNPLFLTAGGVDATGDFAINRYDQTGDSFSIFTHNVVAITDNLDFTIGLRYVEETKGGSYTQLDGEHDACLGTLGAGAGNFLGVAGVGLNCFVFAAPSLGRLGQINPALAANPLAQALLPREFDQTFKDDELVYTLNATYRPTDAITLYGSFTHGFKSGGFNLDASAAVGGRDPRFGSEKVDAYEIGLKADLFDRRARVNVALFDQHLSGFQVLDFTGIQFTTFNVDKARSTGFEIESEAQVSDHLSANLAVTYTDARYPNDCAELDPTAPGFLPNVATLCGASLTNAPDWTIVFGGAYERPVSDRLDVFLTGNARYESARRTSTLPTEVLRPDLPLPGDIQEANIRVNLRAGINIDNGRWALEIWGNNIFDERIRNGTFTVPLRGALGNRARASFISDPATYGVTVRTRF